MEKVRSRDGSSIAFERSGSGPALILVGGAFCDHRARSAGTPLAAELSQRFSVYCYDRRARGESSHVPPYRLEREVEDLKALLQEAGGRAFVYGHSSGAILALEAALAGLPIAKLALYEPPLVLEGRPALPADLPEQLEQLAERGKRAEAAELFLSRAIGLPPAALERTKASRAWPSLEALAHTLSYDARLAADPAAIVERAARVEPETLLLDGSRSPAWLRAGVARLAAAMPRAERRSLAEQNHDAEPKHVAAVLSDFFAG